MVDAYPYIRAYGEMVGASRTAIQRMTTRAVNAQDMYAEFSRPDNEPVWFVEGDGWKYMLDMSQTIRSELRASVAERGGRTDEFIELRDVYGATEVERQDDGEYTTDSPAPHGRTWQERLCAEYGWDDPDSIEWAAVAEVHNGIMVVRTIVVLQTADSVQTYVMDHGGDGHTWVLSSTVTAS